MSKYYVRYIDINGDQDYPNTIKEFGTSDAAKKYIDEITHIARDYLESHVYFYPEQTVSCQGKDPVSIYLNGRVVRLYWIDIDFE